MNALLTVGILALAFLGWVSLFKLVPACSMSLMRYRLWRLRDQLVDEIRQESYDNATAAEILVSRTEAFIEHAPKVSLLNLTLMRLAHRGSPELIDRLTLSMKDLNTDDHARVKAHVDEFENAMLARSMFGTPSGWISILVLVPVSIVIAIALAFRGRPDGGSLTQIAKDQVKAFDPDAASFVGKSSSPEGLWHYV